METAQVVRLSKRQIQILAAIINDGDCNNEEVAKRLGIGVETVKSHKRAIRTKLGVTCTTQAVLKVIRLGLIPLDP